MPVLICIACLVLILNVPSLLDEKDKNVLYVDYDAGKEVEPLTLNLNKKDKPVVDNQGQTLNMEKPPQNSPNVAQDAEDILNDLYNGK